MRIESTRDHRKLVPWIIYLIFFAVLNETVFNVSTPMIARQFSLSPSGVSWMMTIFMVFFGIGSIIYGRLADIFSLRTLIFVGVAVYNVGSLMGFALQSSYPLVIVARAVQGIGGSAIPALVFVVVARYFEPSERGDLRLHHVHRLFRNRAGTGPRRPCFRRALLGVPVPGPHAHADLASVLRKRAAA